MALASNVKAARGLTGDSNLVLSDIHDFVVSVGKEIAGAGSEYESSASKTTTPKLFLMGHSMGGAEALLYMLTSTTPSPSHTQSTLFSPSIPLPISGLLLESPHISFPPAAQPSPLLVLSGRLASKLLPNMQMVQKLDSSAMCRDPKVCKDWENDKLCHDTGTLRGLAGLLDRAAVLDGIGRDGGKKEGNLGGLHVQTKLGVPVFWGHGTGDRVVGFEASKRLFGVVAGGEKDGSVFKPYEGGYHKIHAEPNGMGEEFAKDVGGWILKAGGVEEVRGSMVGGDGTGQMGQEHQQQQTESTTEGYEAVVSEDSENVKSRL